MWPLAFIIAAGRLRLAVAYAAATSFLLLLYFLIPASSAAPGENIGAFLPLHSLRFLGVPSSVLEWAANTSLAHEVWLPVLNLYVPIAMCALALFLLTSKWRAVPSEEGSLTNPRELRATRSCVPYVALLMVSVAAYLLEPTHAKQVSIGVVQTGFRHYAFLRNIYSWATWHKLFFWTVSTPYKDVQGGAWWGTIIVAGPIFILLWSYLSLRGQRAPVVGSAPSDERADDSTAT